MLKSLPLSALVAALALGACNQAPKTTDNAVVDVDNAVAPDDSTLNDTPVVEDADKATAVTVAAVPKAAAGIAAVDAAPLHDAGTIEDEIRDGKNVQRIRYGDGWAWTRGGKIVRTADRDGKEVAYFRPGEGKPFFVQRGDRSYAFKDGKPNREFDHDGKAQAPDVDRAREANEAAEKAHDRREQAEQARDHARDNPRGDRGDHRGPGTRPTPTPSPTPTPDDHHRDRGDRDHN
jgi:FlaG/FlaF family flagellin (archaellin)